MLFAHFASTFCNIYAKAVVFFGENPHRPKKQGGKSLKKQR
jgi:hypothetical protein